VAGTHADYRSTGAAPCSGRFPVVPLPFLQPLLRSAVSYVPSTSLIRVRELRDLPRVLRRAPHERDFLALRSWRVAAPVVVDVGANRGQSIRSFRYVLEDPWLHSMEPNPFLAAHLRTAYRNDPRVQVHQVAVSDAPGLLDLYLPRYGHTVYDTRAALSPEAPEEFLSPASFAGFRPNRAIVEKVQVTVTTLDQLEVQPQLIKIDVEGADDRAVAGATELLTRCRPLVLVEFPQASTVDVMERLGYTPHAYDADADRLVGGCTGELNTYFLLPEHREQFTLRIEGRSH
jgi:FkbM family methyltransferase